MRERILNGYRVIYFPNHPSAMKSNNWNGFIHPWCNQVALTAHNGCEQIQIL